MSDITLHIDENINLDERDIFRSNLLKLNGVTSTKCHDTKRHLMVVEYDANVIDSSEFIYAATKSGLHAELLGL